MGRLPTEVTSFVGRRHEVAEVKKLLSASRMVTLTGVGGVGKTRLASRVAADVRRAFLDGVWMVELAALEDPDLLVQTVTESLEVRDYSSRPAMEVLTEYLRDKQVLLILDNCEHLLHECATVAEALLRSTPDLRILATSRQPLDITGEQTLAVPTLSLPDSDVPRPSATSLAQSDAVRLFTERAGAILPGFAVTETNRNVVERICRRLDGIPLGIELAAVRLRVLSPEQLLARLDDQFRLLTSGSRTVLPRHQTLRALIDWSHVLCTEHEQLLWARTSVFSGGLDLEAAEAVCAGDGIERDEVLDLVSGLVDKSVLLREEQSCAVRYRLLETIRQYGREQLAASGQESTLQRRHRDYYQGLAATANAELFGPSQVGWFTRLQQEHANIRTALDYCFTEPGETRAGLSMSSDLLYHWITSYYLGEGRRWLDRGLAADTTASADRARALWANSWLAIIQADITSAAAMLEECRAMAEQLDAEPARAYVALYSGMVAMCRGETDSAIKLYEEAASRHRTNGDPVGHASALIRLCLAHSFLGDSARAIAIGEECLTVCDAHGEGWHKAYTMMALGVEVWRQGDTARATALEKESLHFNRSLNDPLGVGVNLEVLAWIASTEGDHRRAATLLGILRTVWEAIGAPLSGYGHLVRYHDACEAQTRKALSESAFRTAFKEGTRLSYQEALAYGLQERMPQEELAEGAGRPSPLTRRETEIAGLVAEGLSNKEIAAALVIAQRTAEGHIEHILSKLGCSSRAQIAVWVAERNRSSAGDEDGASRGPR
ncbi:LuxR family transcriptional regulator [Wenjunlia tyrosinilytica]|uniref:LuxR family transcriptional regulator n=2 Tax=Wenjunlia tyrosinilytica TaxID=1544741 RepID=A0A918DZJ3_9ACTN|nr:LuxR family transcriptional regulator [Wenjunlia tyrosinilytica]